MSTHQNPIHPGNLNDTINLERLPFEVFRLADNAEAAKTGIDAGSAVVALTSESGSGFDVYYEGNRYGAENLRTFEDKVGCAAGRALYRYPTIARTHLPVINSAFHYVGTWDGHRLILDGDEKDYADWNPELATLVTVVQKKHPAAECLELPDGLTIPGQKTLFPYFLIVDTKKEPKPSTEFIALFGHKRACDIAQMIGQGRTREEAWRNVNPN